MARDADGIILIKYANSGDVGLGGLDLNNLWPISYSTPGGPYPQRIQFNQLFRYLSALAVEINEEGPYLEWTASIDYVIGSVVKGSDGREYKSIIANGPATGVVDPAGDSTGTWGGPNRIDSAIKTSNYSILIADDNTKIIQGSATASILTHTFPSVGATQDGMKVSTLNDSYFDMNIKGRGSDRVGNSGPGEGMVSITRGGFAKWEYRHAITTWVPIAMGGKWMVSGLKLYITCDEISLRDVDSGTTIAATRDLTKKHRVLVRNAIGIKESTDLGSMVFDFPGVDEDVFITTPLDLNFMSTKTAVSTIFLRMSFDNVASASSYILAHREDGNNAYSLLRNASGEFQFNYIQAGNSNQISGGSIGATTDVWLSLVRNEGVVGIFIGTSQVAYLADVWNIDTFVGSFFIGQRGDDSGFVDGKYQLIGYAEQNIFNAVINSDGTSGTIENPGNIPELVIGF